MHCQQKKICIKKKNHSRKLLCILQWRCGNGRARLERLLAVGQDMVLLPAGFQSFDARNIGWVEWIAKLAKSLAKESFDLVLLLIWNIWKDRNELIWQGSSRHPIDIHYNS